MSLHDTDHTIKGQVRPAWEVALDRPIPANIDAERSLLGALFVSNRAAELIPDIRPEHFFSPLHGEIFAAFMERFEAGRTVTPTTLAAQFEKFAVDASTNGAQYLGSILASATSVAYVREYARLIVDLSQRRALIVVAEDISARAYDTSDRATPSDLIDDAERALFSVATQGRKGREVAIKDAAHAAVKSALKAFKCGGRIDGIETGLVDLDHQLGGGLGNSDLIVLGGRPSMGKTALATKIALNVARGTPWTNPETGEHEDAMPHHVHFFSLEMSGEQLAQRQLSDLSGVPSHKIRRGQFSEAQFRDIEAASRLLSSVPMTIDETGGISIGALAAKARREKRKNNTGLIVVDYLQLMQGTGGGNRNRVQEITEITTGLKAIGKELNVPVLALSQLNRGLEKQEDKRPQLSDLRESGSIEQDADVVMFVFREEYYLQRNKPDAKNSPDFADWQRKMATAAGRAEVIVGKARHGPVGTVALAFDGNLTRFSNLAREDQGYV